MKHEYTDTQLQAAIDGACLEIRREHRGKVGTNLVIDTDALPCTYKAEASARLDLIKAALAALPEPEPSLSQLRPIAEAGEVPEGCVRYYTYKKDGEWTTKSKYRAMQDTHYIDTRLPYSAEKPAPLVTKPISPPTWTPKVGDVVTLKSGGPKMTVGEIHKDEAKVFGFKDDSLVHAFVPAATLTPA